MDEVQRQALDWNGPVSLKPDVTACERRTGRNILFIQCVLSRLSSILVMSSTQTEDIQWHLVTLESMVLIPFFWRDVTYGSQNGNIW